MSRKQWGHGYYTGLKAADNGLYFKRYIATVDEKGYLVTLYRVLAENGNIFTVENITEYTYILVLMGRAEWFAVPGNNDDITHEKVSEIVGDEKMIFFSSQQACESWVIANWGEWCDKERNRVMQEVKNERGF